MVEQQKFDPASEALRVAAGDDRTHYDPFAIALHWTTATLVFGLFLLAMIWDFFPKPERHLLIVAHLSFGIIFAIVLVVRIGWRPMPGHQVSPAVVGWTEIASKAVHYSLYALLLTQAALGFTTRWLGEAPMSFFGLEMPSPFAPASKLVRELFEEVHDWVGWAIVILAAGHALAALYHHYALKDDVLWRMLPGGRDRRAEQAAPAP
jgi:cytochrome b561